MEESGKRSQSIVWDHFEKVAETPNKAKCKICNAKFQHSKNTSNLLKHLTTKHALVYEESMERLIAGPSGRQKQQTLEQSLSKRTKYSKNSEKSNKLNKALPEMITTDMQPAYIVEDKGFIKFVGKLDPCYELPSRRTVMRKLLPEAYEDAKRRLKNTLQDTDHLALTTDIWTSMHIQAYICVTGHFITSLWEIKSVVLETAQLLKDHTSETIATELKRIAEEREISNKITLLVTDNASNMLAAARLCTPWRHIPCFAHTLNLVVTNILEKHEDIVNIRKKVRYIVTFFHSSVKASDRLTEVQRQQNIPEHKLIQEVQTRWNSTFYIFERMIEQHQAVTTVLCLLGKNEMCPSAQVIEEIKGTVKVLKPFETATREVSADLPLTISKIIPMARSLQETLSKYAPEITENEKKLYNELMSQLRRRFSQSELNFSPAAATFLDPRFKKIAFASEANFEQMQRRLTSEMSSMDIKLQPEEEVERIESATSDTSLWSWIDEKASETERNRTNTVDATLELKQYPAERRIARTEDPLEFWKQHSEQYSRLSILAKKLSWPCASTSLLLIDVLALDLAGLCQHGLLLLEQPVMLTDEAARL
ncbi:zinc finger BED domain-containing protein 4-like [Macrobrachium rosenbergii]|uniref:zinc finger BED domain-containing protein 4-like n=1 Tax=Macrobrachium rosenbergii TaxID=79674 RepID=UPI0034D5A66B